MKKHIFNTKAQACILIFILFALVWTPVAAFDSEVTNEDTVELAVDQAPISELQRTTSNDSELLSRSNQSNFGADKTITWIVRIDDPKFRTQEETVITTDTLKSRAIQSQQPVIEQIAAQQDIEVINQLWITNAIVVEADPTAVSKQDLTDIDQVSRVHKDYIFNITTAAVDTQSHSQISINSHLHPNTTGSQTTYGLDLIEAPAVWDTFGARGSGVGVAVLDSGVDVDHNSITLSGWAEFDNRGIQVTPSSPYDNDGHGTHVAGTVAGSNASGVSIGVAPDVALYGVKVTDDEGQGTFSQISSGMEWAAENDDVDILQISLGADGYIDAFIDPVQNARLTGKNVVVSAGNSGNETSASPGNVYDSFAVGAINSDRTVAGFSSGEIIETSTAWSTAPSQWPKTYIVPDISAPGVQVESAATGTTDSLSTKSGTSMSAPHVSGTIALLRSMDGVTITDDEIRGILRNTASQPAQQSGPDQRYGYGIINAYNAASSIFDSQPTRANFTVGDLESDETVSRGDTVTTRTSVTNTGDATGTQDITLRIAKDGTHLDDNSIKSTKEAVRLEGGESQLIELTHNTSDLPPGTYQHGIFTNNDSVTGTIKITSGPETVINSTSVTITPDIANQTAIYQTEFEYESIGKQTAQYISLSFGTDDVDFGSVVGNQDAITVVGPEEDIPITEVYQLNESTLLIELAEDGITEPTSGDTIAIEARDINNPSAETYELETSLHETGDAILDIAADAFASDTIAYTVTPEPDPDHFEVTSLEPKNTSVAQGSKLNITAIVTNIGGTNGTQNSSLKFGPTIENVTTVTTSENITLTTGESTTVEFVLDTASIGPGSYTYGVFTLNDNMTTDLSITPPIGEVSINNQTQIYENGNTVATVEYVTATEQFAVAIVDTEGNTVGTTAVFEPHTVRENYTVELDPEMTRRQQITARLYHASEDGEIDFNKPYETESGIIESQALLTINGPIVVGNSRAQDLEGDGLFDDVNGDGTLDIFDIQSFFSRLATQSVQNNSILFDFSESDPQRANIFDVQKLFEIQRSR